MTAGEKAAVLFTALLWAGALVAFVVDYREKAVKLALVLVPAIAWGLFVWMVLR